MARVLEYHWRQIKRLWKDRRGQDLVEYAMLVAMISLLTYSWLPQGYASSLSKVWAKVRSVMTVLTGV